METKTETKIETMGDTVKYDIPADFKPSKSLSLDSSDSSDEMITLILESDNSKWNIPKSYLKISKLYTDTLNSDRTATEIPVGGGITNATMKDIEWVFKHYKGTEGKTPEAPLKTKVLEDYLTKDEAKFYNEMKENRQQLYDFILAMNYMDIKFALHQACSVTASLIKGQPLDQIKEILSKGLPKKMESQKEEVASAASASAVVAK